MVGLRKNRPQGDLRLPISLQSLTSMLATLDKLGLSHYLNALYKAMLTVSFFAFLRPSECTGLLHNLQYQDVSFEQGSLTIIFSHYKHSSGPLLSSKCHQLGETPARFAPLLIFCPLGVILRAIYSAIKTGPLCLIILIRKSSLS